jgi:hypothetical protein
MLGIVLPFAWGWREMGRGFCVLHLPSLAPPRHPCSSSCLILLFAIYLKMTRLWEQIGALSCPCSLVLISRDCHLQSGV